MPGGNEPGAERADWDYSWQSHGRLSYFRHNDEHHSLIGPSQKSMCRPSHFEVRRLGMLYNMLAVWVACLVTLLQRTPERAGPCRRRRLATWVLCRSLGQVASRQPAGVEPGNKSWSHAVPCTRRRTAVSLLGKGRPFSVAGRAHWPPAQNLRLPRSETPTKRFKRGHSHWCCSRCDVVEEMVGLLLQGAGWKMKSALTRMSWCP